MPSEIGPHDGRRARRSRCDACVNRRIKCRDGMPCENCKRTGRACTMTTNSETLLPVFVGDTRNKRPVAMRAHTTRNDATIYLPPSLDTAGDDSAFLYFFQSFLPKNILASDIPFEAELLEMAKKSGSLRDAVRAIGTLHRGQQDQLAIGAANRSHETYQALQAYDQSVRSVRNLIGSKSFLSDPSAFWTTFLLGLFELMRDSAGLNWLSHFLHGTCTILCHQHPASLSRSGEYNMRKRRFFFATRIFEIARSLIYSSPSFLSEPKWVNALENMRKDENKVVQHPKEALFDILPRISDLSIRAMRFCEYSASVSLDAQSAMTQSLADEGLALESLLERWCVETEQWEQSLRYRHTTSDTQTKPGIELLVGYVYYHAIKIYLSGTFDYHIQWTWPNAPSAPILAPSQINWHVSEILRISQELLILGVSGILLFFPLRVAGARAIDACTKTIILDLLQTTARRGFIVAQAFTLDLSELWASQSMLL